MMRLFLLGVSSLCLGFSPSFSQAQPTLRLSSGATTVTIVDQGAGDINPAVGIVSPGFIMVGNFFIDPTTTGTSTAPLGTDNEVRIDLLLNAFSAVPGMHTLTGAFSDTGFVVPPGPNADDLLFTTAVGGYTTGGTLDSLFGSLDPSNTLFGMPLATTVTLAGLGPGSFDGADAVKVPPGDPFSLTLAFEVTHTGAQITGFNSDTLYQNPEPTSFLIWATLGGATVGVSALRRRRAKKS